MPTILFTGGGSAGHVTPNLALIEQFQKKQWQIIYVGSENGIEKEIISRINIPYYAISSGKLRRSFSWKNLLSPFQVIYGIWQAFLLCRKIKPNIVFSKGGFVAFPVVVGAWMNRIPVVSHESDLTPGLANRLSFPFSQRICVTFAEGAKFFKNQQKVLVTGTPIRPMLLQGNADNGRSLCGFNADKPILLVIGGGLGSENLNRAIRAILPKLLSQFQLIHLCGKGKTDTQHEHAGYKQFEYANEELADLFACADIIISRAGANAIYELLTLKKPHLLIPLSKKASRGDQIINAEYFAKQNLSQVLLEENLTADALLNKITSIYQHRAEIQKHLMDFPLPNSVTMIVAELERLAKYQG